MTLIYDDGAEHLDGIGEDYILEAEGVVSCGDAVATYVTSIDVPHEVLAQALVVDDGYLVCHAQEVWPRGLGVVGEYKGIYVGELFEFALPVDLQR